MFVLPAIVASIALRESTDSYEAHWPDQRRPAHASPRQARQGFLAQTLTLFIARLNR